jgi:hypothetical protein
MPPTKAVNASRVDGAISFLAPVVLAARDDSLLMG